MLFFFLFAFANANEMEFMETKEKLGVDFGKCDTEKEKVV